MALLKDRVKESTTTTGTGTLTLTGAVSGYRRFSAALTNGDVTYYCIESDSAWEVGIGTYSANTLTRDTVLASSNAGSQINITASRSFVFITYAADKAVYENSAGYVQIDSGVYYPDGTTQTTAFGGSISATGISSVPPSSILGNNTASTGYASGLSPSNVRTLLGLATTSDVTFDIVRATSSVLTPLVSNTASQLTLTGGPDVGYFSFPSVLLKTTTSSTEYVRTYSGGGSQVLALHANGQSPSILMLNSTGDLSLANQVTNGDISLTTYGAGGYVNITNATNNGVLRVRQVEDTNTALILGNSTYGVTVPGNAMFSGGIVVNGATDSANSVTTGNGAGVTIAYLSSVFGHLGFNAKYNGSAYVCGQTGYGLSALYVNSTGTLQFNALPSATAGGSYGAGTTIASLTRAGLLTVPDASVTGTVQVGNATESGTGAKLFVETGIYTPGFLWSTGYARCAALTTTGDISMSKTSAQGYIRAWDSTGAGNVFMWHGGSAGYVDSSLGSLRLKGSYTILEPTTAISYCYTPGTNSQFQVYNTNGQNGLILSTDGTNAAITTFGGAGLTIAPAGGTVAVTGAVTTTGDISMSKTSAQGYIRAYSPDGTKSGSFYCDNAGGDTYLYANNNWLGFGAQGGVNFFYKAGVQQSVRFYSSDALKWSSISTNTAGLTVITCDTHFSLTCAKGTIQTVSDYIECAPANGIMYTYTAGTNSQFRTYNATAAKYTNITHDGTNGILSTSSGALVLSPATSIIGIGGITSSFPAIKRSSTTAAFRLGDDSADAPISCAGITASGLVKGSETTSTPAGTTQTVTLESGNFQTLDLTSSTGDVTVTLTVPASSSRGSLLIKQHATTARDITWAASSGTITWLGTEPTWNGDATSSFREVSWRFNGTNTFLSSSGSS